MIVVDPSHLGPGSGNKPLDPMATVPGIEVARAVFRPMLQNDEVAEEMCYLWSRWQDEHEYEDFNEYIKRMKKMLEGVSPKISFVKATKRPFELHMKHEGCDAIFALKATGRGLALRSYRPKPG